MSHLQADAADMLPRLSATSPLRRKSAVPVRVVVFGGGRFNRAFIGDLADRGLAAGIDARLSLFLSIQSASLLSAQDCRYTLAIDPADGPVESRIIDAVAEAISLRDDWPRAIGRFCDPALSLVLSNTTEAGLRTSPDDSRDDPARWSFPARLARLLAERHARLGPEASRLCLVPCELVRDNAGELRGLLERTAANLGLSPAFQTWLGDLDICGSLVDRIVTGAPSADALPEWWGRLGYRDDLIVRGESYFRWVVMRPRRPCSVLDAWAGLPGPIRPLLVHDLAAERATKLRLLNGTHTVSAALALFLGCATVAEGMSHPQLGVHARSYLEGEAVPSLGSTAEVRERATAVMLRFAHPRLGHRWVDIAAGSSRKAGERLFPVMRMLSGSGLRTPACARGVGAWLAARSPGGPAEHLVDALPPPRAATALENTSALRDLLNDASIWGEPCPLADNPQFLTQSLAAARACRERRVSDFLRAS